MGIGKSLVRLTAAALLLTAVLGPVFGPALAQEADTTAVLDVATNADPTLNPWTPGAVIESNLINTILFDQLTRYSPEDLTPVPALATSWTPDADGLGWVFELRQGVVWSDGEPFTAADVAFTFNDVVLNASLGAQHPSGRWWTYNTPMDGIREASAHTIVFQSRAGTSGMTSSNSRVRSRCASCACSRIATPRTWPKRSARGKYSSTTCATGAARLPSRRTRCGRARTQPSRCRCAGKT